MYTTIDTNTTELFYDQLTQLDGVEYLLSFIWSDRESAWYLSIYDQDKNPLALAIRLNISWPLLRRFADPRLPPGLLFCGDTSGMNQDIAVPADLGSRVILFYITGDEPDIAGINLREPL